MGPISLRGAGPSLQASLGDRYKDNAIEQSGEGAKLLSKKGSTERGVLGPRRKNYDQNCGGASGEYPGKADDMRKKIVIIRIESLLLLRLNGRSSEKAHKCRVITKAEVINCGGCGVLPTEPRTKKRSEVSGNKRLAPHILVSSLNICAGSRAACLHQRSRHAERNQLSPLYSGRAYS
ncbi:hypothetical protein NPIL_82291 [Nephila pilipes]|uniref:Uncharacterized protein n=1 Tax=Nephila pilipes TaxID=299642 RepID=A0A8X6UQ52_NEPPI|nr:hypothetical protein NPIL_82291 [Nephila pilipes]